MELEFFGKEIKRTSTKRQVRFDEKTLTVNKKGRISFSPALVIETGMNTGKSFMFAYDKSTNNIYLAVLTTDIAENAFKFKEGGKYVITNKFQATMLYNKSNSTTESFKLSATKFESQTVGVPTLYKLTLVPTVTPTTNTMTGSVVFEDAIITDSTATIEPVMI